MSVSPLLHRRRAAHQALRVVVTVGALIGLSACTSMKDIPPGSSVADIQAHYGAPTVECPGPDGSRRLVWSTQPMGQYAWATTAGQDGKVAVVEQILTDAAFREVEVGVWNTDQLQCAFGPPAEITTVGLPGAQHLIWSYRYRQSGAWNSLMHVYLSEKGIVQRMHPGPDPLFDPLEFPFW